jgi:hypothetical protein
MKKMNKRGQDLVLPIVIFLILNIAFFTLMLVFVQRVSSNAIVYEEIYAKKIGLILNRAEPGMSLQIDVTPIIKIALKNGIQTKDMQEVIKIDTEKGIVTVMARKEGGFSYPYFSKIKLDMGSLQATTRLGQINNEQGKIVGGIFYINILK